MFQSRRTGLLNCDTVVEPRLTEKRPVSISANGIIEL